MRFVLVEPSHPGNVGATARAMRTMGLAHLALVAPRFPGVAGMPEAIAYSSGAHPLLEASRELPTLKAALDGVTLAIAVSAAGRAFGPPVEDPPASVVRALRELAAHPSHRVAFVFGAERTGLSVEQVSHCQALLAIPSDPEFSSLNLSQAVQVVAWELRRAFVSSAQGEGAGGLDTASDSVAAEPAATGPDPASAASDPLAQLREHALRRRLRRAAESGRLASTGEIEALFAHLERALVDVKFLDPAHPKKLMPRLRRLFGRTRLEAEEVELLRGICTQMTDAAHRTGAFRRHDAQRGEPFASDA